MDSKFHIRIRQVETEARASYNRVAAGYNDPSHETVRNFEDLLQDFLTRHLHHILPPRETSCAVSIDIGGGRGWVARLMSKHGYKAILGDISESMLLHARKQHADHLRYCQLSAFSLPFRREVANLVTTMLCGAYLCREVVEQIYQLLVDGGTFVISETPKEWVAATQPAYGMPDGKTWYKDSTGHNVFLPFSYVYTLEELRHLVTSCGFEVIIAENLTPSMVIPPEGLSRVNRGAAKTLGVPVGDVPILSALIARRQ